MSHPARKILFLVEPLQLRNSAQTFFAVASQWLLCASQSARHEFHFFSSSGNIDYLLSINPLITRPLSNGQFTRASGDFQRIIDDCAAADWALSGFLRWREVILGTGDISAALRADLAWLRAERFDFDTVVVWGANGGARAFCEAEGLVCLNCEMGATRGPVPTSIYVDPFGSHAAAMLPRLSAADVPPCEPKWKTRAEPLPEAKRRRPRALVALQVSDDANLIGLPDGPMDLTSDSIARVRKLLLAGYTVEVKGHPGASLYPWTLTEQDECCRRAAALPGVSIMNDVLSEGEYVCYLKSFDLIAGRSSSLMFEASLLGVRACVDAGASFALRDTYPSLDAALGSEGAWDGYADRVRRNTQFYLRNYAHFSVIDRGDLMGEIAGFHAASCATTPDAAYVERWLGEVGALLEAEFDAKAAPELRRMSLL
jgi:hypothetical protein